MHESTGQIGASGQRATRLFAVRRLGIFSVAKVFTLLYAGIGLLIGALFSLLSIVGSVLGSMIEGEANPLLGMLFGVGAIIVLPIFYGILGFIGGVVSAALYNFCAGLIGGIEVELSER